MENLSATQPFHSHQQTNPSLQCARITLIVMGLLAVVVGSLALIAGAHSGLLALRKISF